MKNSFSDYTTDYISGVMSLRKPQEESLNILNNIFNSITPSKNIDLESALKEVNNMYPTLTDFERDFVSLSFSIATGVGKTRLMGAFIAYLYTNHGIKNFFVVAPNTTIYSKLKKDLGDPSNPKYVFNGLGCFSKPPKVIADESYRNQPNSFFDGEVNIYVFNISKFDKENVRMKSVNEYLGESFYNMLSSLDDLVLIMDESHHYHAEKGAKALNELKPILGLELTATPYYTKGNKQINFENIVYEYPISKAIADGYTRTPFALTRENVDFKNFGDEELDRAMINDGLIAHEKTKLELAAYAKESNSRLVKPFMMIVCKDTNHAKEVYDYIISDSFSKGDYANKTLIIHSNQKKADIEANNALLQKVEDLDNPIEIVIHVDMLKEGWDVNNLYTIVPLRTAASKILREQMVGRGLRLPYGKRTGVKEIDLVMLTAHDNFQQLLAEAEKGDSIFKKGNVIKVEDIENQKIETTQIKFIDDEEKEFKPSEKILFKKDIDKTFIDKTNNVVKKHVEKYISSNSDIKNKPDEKVIIDSVKKEIEKDYDLTDVIDKNLLPIELLIKETTKYYTGQALNKFINIPIVIISNLGQEEYEFLNFELDTSNLNHIPLNDNIMVQNIEKKSDSYTLKVEEKDYLLVNPYKELIGLLRDKSEIDYEKTSEYLYNLISKVVSHYSSMHGEEGMKNIIYNNKKDIANNIYRQMIKPENFYFSNGEVEEVVSGLSYTNHPSNYQFIEEKGLFNNYNGPITKILFTGLKKSVFSKTKFDSRPELLLARVLENDTDVIKWLRPNIKDFNLVYNRNKYYEPDFVVETYDCCYLVEVKGEDKLEDADVIAKKERAIKYCALASKWAIENGHKEWKHIFIPASQIQVNSTFRYLAGRFIERG